MRKTLFITIITSLTFFFTARGQQRPHIQDISANRPPLKTNNVRLTDINSNKFVGTWKWKSGNRYLILTLFKTDYNYGNSTSKAVAELLKGYYIYDNGFSQKNTATDTTITASTAGENSVAYLLISDKAANKSNSYKLSYINTDTVRFALSDRFREGFDNKNSLKLPVDVILVKMH